jgi:phosphoribosylamine--glycine ligase
MGKRVLVIGQGGREHALVWKIAQSPQVSQVFAAPGNPGISEIAECVEIQADDIEGLVEFAKASHIDLTVVGPEGPLIKGIVDRFREEKLPIFGPAAGAAQLEGSKVFAKNLFRKYGIPTAGYQVCADYHDAIKHAQHYIYQGKPAVIKADGLAAGKGVVIAHNMAQASQALENIMRDLVFGQAGKRVVIEEFLEGEEVSFFALSDGTNFLSLMAAQDHKRVFDNDQGPNTGGMGAYTNPPLFTPELQLEVINRIIKPVIAAMASEGHPYEGVLYAGLMVTPEGPKVLEFNARLGDPETQVVLPMIKGDILPYLEAVAGKSIASLYGEKITAPFFQVDTIPGTCIGVILASEGYPGSYEKGRPITGIDKLSHDTLVFHAGTSIKEGQLVSDGGRVLAIVTSGQDIRQAIDKVYGEVRKVYFKGMHYRRDIGKKALKPEGE